MLDLMMQDQDFMKFQEDMLADFEDDMVDELQQVRGKPMRLCIYVCVCVCVCFPQNIQSVRMKHIETLTLHTKH